MEMALEAEGLGDNNSGHYSTCISVDDKYQLREYKHRTTCRLSNLSIRILSRLRQ